MWGEARQGTEVGEDRFFIHSSFLFAVFEIFFTRCVNYANIK